MEYNIEIINDECLKFNNYPFKPSTVVSNSVIGINGINEIRTNYPHISLLINNNELVFIPKHQEKEIVSFLTKKRVLLNESIDVWTLLNSPFEHDIIDEVSTNKILNELKRIGFSEEEISRIRNSTGKMMGSVTTNSMGFGELDWYDTLRTKRASFLNLYLSSAFYWDVMRIALKGNVSKEIKW